MGLHALQGQTIGTQTMRVPDEGNYRKGQKHLEDLRGWKYCPHCDKCTLTHQNQIHTDGMFFCLFFRKWKRGDDLVEFRCDGYKVKSCHTCWHVGFCPNKFKGKFCESYKRADISHHGAYHMGRRRPLSDTDPYARKAEEHYIEQKRKIWESQGADHKGDGSIEAGARPEQAEGHEGMGHL